MHSGLHLNRSILIKTPGSCMRCGSETTPLTDSLHDSYAGPSNPKRARIADDESSQPEVTSPPNFTTLLIELLNKVSADWEDIGLILKLEQGDLSAIKTDHQDSKKCFREMLKLWLKQINPPPSWSAIINAIKVLEHKPLAEELRKKYCN